MKFLLDTNVVSEAHRPQCHPAVRTRLTALDDIDLNISVITLGELANGIAQLPIGPRRKELQDWLAETEVFFSDRILPVDRDIARLWGSLTATAKQNGRTLSAADGLIAATALHHDLHLMTRNVAGFMPTGVRVINPWDAT